MLDNHLDARIRIIAKEEIRLRRSADETIRLHKIGGFEFSPCAVADVEHLNLLPFLLNAVDHTVDIGLAAVKQVSQLALPAR
jgi:hypothetical protein